MSIQPLSSVSAKHAATYAPLAFNARQISIHTPHDSIQFGHQHAHGKTCTDSACKLHHHHDHPPKHSSNNVFSKIGLWFYEFFGGMVEDFQKFGRALISLLIGKPKDKHTHKHDHHHHHGPDCKGHHHH